MHRRLTKRVVDALAARDHPWHAWDAEIPGFGVRIQPTGRRTWIYRYRPKGTGRKVAQRTVTIAAYGTLTADQAREIAQELQLQVRAGRDPVVDRAALHGAPDVDRLADLYLEWLQRHRRPGSVRVARSVIDRHVRPAIGRMRVAEVRRSHIAAIRDRLQRSGRPRMAGLVIQVTRAAFNRAELDEAPWHQMRAPHSNPCAKLEVHLGERRRRRLGLDELWRFLRALRAGLAEDGENVHALALFLLVLLTGARWGEIAGARRAWIDREAGVLRLPATKTGPREIVLSAAAMRVVDAIPAVPGNPWLIVGRRTGSRLVSPTAPWRRLLARAGIEGLTIHDLRRTYASLGLDRGVPLEAIGQLLGHSQAQTTMRYSYMDLEPQRLGATRIAAMLELLGEAKDEQALEAVRVKLAGGERADDAEGDPA